MTPELLFQVCAGVLARIAGAFVACGHDAPATFVARQGSAADDGCPCEGQLVAIPGDSTPGQDEPYASVGGGAQGDNGACVSQVTFGFRLRYSCCWPATAKSTNTGIVLPSPTEIENASRTQLVALHVLNTALYGGEAFAGLADLGLDYEEIRVSRVTPYTAGGCAGWNATVSVTMDIGA